MGKEAVNVTITLEQSMKIQEGKIPPIHFNFG